MKLNKYMLLAATVVALVFTGCKSNEPFDTQSSDDYPRILYPVNESGTGTFTYTLDNPDVPLHDSAIVTPSKFTTVQWLLDNHVVNTGLHINMCLPAGKYNLKIVATTEAGKSNSRWGTVTVHPYDIDPYSDKVGNERIVAPGAAATLLGQNLSVVKKIAFMEEYPWPAQGAYAPTRATAANIEITDFTATDSQIDYTVPAELKAGTYYIAFYDAEGKLYGANKLDVVNSALAIDGYAEAVEGGKIEITGMYLNMVKSLKLAGEDIFEITALQATENSITAELPKDAKVGKYILTGIQEDGAALQFATAEGIVSEVQFAILPSGETEICKGPADMINWGDVFVDIDLAKLAECIGQQMNVYYEEVEADYHQMKFVSAPSWAYGGDGNPSMPDAPFYDHFEESEGTVSFTVTQAMYNACAEDGGGLRITGYGYKIIKVTVGSGAKETEICKGPADMINWGDVFVDIEVATLSDILGRQMNVYYEEVEADYHQMKFVSAPSWAYGGDGNPSMPDAPFYDHFEESEGTVSFTVTQAMYDACAEDGGGLRITGYGYKIIKVTYN